MQFGASALIESQRRRYWRTGLEHAQEAPHEGLRNAVNDPIGNRRLNVAPRIRFRIFIRSGGIRYKSIEILGATVGFGDCSYFDSRLNEMVKELLTKQEHKD